MNNVINIFRANYLSLDEHIENIILARDKMNESLYEFIDAIRMASEQLPPKTFQNELCSKLSMNKSVLSKWISISNSEFIKLNLSNLPTCFSSLYTITLIEKKFQERYKSSPNEEIQYLIKSGRITKQSERIELEEILRRISQDIRLSEAIKRSRKILSLSGNSYNSISTVKNIKTYLKENKKFGSFVIIPSERQIKSWSDNGLFPSEISNEIPLHELRIPSISQTLCCFIKVKLKKIETGIKLLNAWGFTFRDILVPCINKAKYNILNNENILIRGERGVPRKLRRFECQSLETDDILELIEEN